MIHTQHKQFTLHHASCLDVMDSMEENSVDAIITDPPYHLQSIVDRFGKQGSAEATTKNNDGSFARLSKGFMGKEWDGGDIAFRIETWKKALRVLKPGGHILAFNHSRTFHRMAVAIEDAGFQIRDTIMWLYGSGFPKSHNVGLNVDKKLGVAKNRGKAFVTAGQSGQKDKDTKGNLPSGSNTIGASTTDNKWNGWGTALKPAYEPIILARKPFKSTIAENVLKHGVGGINIDGCRVGTEDFNGKTFTMTNHNQKDGVQGIYNATKMNAERLEYEQNKLGRFPANVIHDGSDEVTHGMWDWETDSNASRYFYTAKASKKDRDEGLNTFQTKSTGELQGGRKEGSAGSIMPDDGRLNPYAGAGAIRKNTHPTVKPTDLMQYLIRLITPPNGVVLDLFMGSGSTGKACMIENTLNNANYHFIGVDLEKEYCDISKARIEYGINYVEEKEKERKDIAIGQTSIFDEGLL